MQAALISMWMTAALAAAPAETKFFQVAPHYREVISAERSEDEDCAVVLVQGFVLHTFDNYVEMAKWQRWQRPGSSLVKALAKESDIYAVAYGQNGPLDDVAASAEFAGGIERLKQLEYSQIVLVGHSAGGLIARQFVEDQPVAGVTKVIQVCTPNGGSCWGEAGLAVPKRQEIFLASLSYEGRQGCLAQRCEKKIPEHVDFVCLVGQLEFRVDMSMSVELWNGKALNISATKDFRGDGIVSSACQWTSDLQEQGIPAVTIPICHLQAMRDEAVIQKLAELVNVPQPRLSDAEVATLRQQVLGDK